VGRIRILLVVLMAVVLQAGGFDPVKDVPMSVSGGVLTVTIPQGVHLKVRFFKVTLASGGQLDVDALPAPSGQDDAGDPIWRGVLQVGLQAHDLEDPARIVITYQPCTEGPEGRCYLPVKRTFTLSVGAFTPKR
jgi:hypothetical protein